MKPPRGTLSLPIIFAVACVLVFIAIFYAERFGSFSPTSFFKFKCCYKSKTTPQSNDKETEEDAGYASFTDDRFEFGTEECNVANGKWVFNRSIEPLYTDRSCPYVDKQFSCAKNGRPDSRYLHWEWKPEGCSIPRFNPELALKKLQGKRLLFVGDSLQRIQWESFVCLVHGFIPYNQRSMKVDRIHPVFTAEKYNATIEFYWAPYLVNSNTDIDIIGDLDKRIIKVDSITERAKNWTGVDILVFNTYVWWRNDFGIKSLWGSFANGEEGYEELDAPVAYNLALKTWANWVDSTIDPNRTRVFFTTMSPIHTRSEDWGGKAGLKCFNETKPVRKKYHWGTGSDKTMMSVVAKVLKKMKVPVQIINITQLSEYRIDAHSSVYTENGGNLLTEEERTDPKNADCVHWCLPGVPDTWNQIFLAML